METKNLSKYIYQPYLCGILIYLNNVSLISGSTLDINIGLSKVFAVSEKCTGFYLTALITRLTLLQECAAGSFKSLYTINAYFLGHFHPPNTLQAKPLKTHQFTVVGRAISRHCSILVLCAQAPKKYSGALLGTGPVTTLMVSAVFLVA